MTILASENGSIIGIINPADRVGTTTNGTAIDLAVQYVDIILASKD